MEKTFFESHKLFDSVKTRIPLATQTFSKSFLQYVREHAPLFLTRGEGSHVWDVDGNEYVDFVNALLPVMLGYKYPAVDAAIEAQLKKGIIFSLPSPLEDELAQLLIKHIPCAEMVRFGKNGSDVTTGAVRLARAITHRDHIASYGYHGWHDWSIGVTTRNLGVPEATRALTHKFNYNDFASVQRIFEQHPGRVAAVIMEPMNYTEPENRFLEKVAELTRREGALLIFDEVITGFRFGLGGAQRVFGVIPDLACFGKAMANGMPISALVGKRAFMQRVDDIFYSFTQGGELLSIAAAIATIHELETKGVGEAITSKGAYLKERTLAAIKEAHLEDVLALRGRPCWSVFIIQAAMGFSDLEIKSYLQQELLQEGFLWYGQHNISYSHTQEDLDALLAAYRKLFSRLRSLLDRGMLREALKGEPITNIFSVR